MKQTIACLSILCAAGAALPTIAKNINVEASKIPTTVEVPVGIAAAACGVSASDLAMKSSGGAVS
jgi:hypothetical protein